MTLLRGELIDLMPRVLPLTRQDARADHRSSAEPHLTAPSDYISSGERRRELTSRRTLASPCAREREREIERERERERRTELISGYVDRSPAEAERGGKLGASLT